MRQFTGRRLLIPVAGPLIVAQLGCAARSIQVPPGAPAATIAEADRKACDEYAQKQKTTSVLGLTILGVVAVPVSVGLAGASLATMNLEGLRILGAGPGLLEAAATNARANAATRETAMRQCLKPIRLEQAVGPEHPALAESLANLAHGYAALGDRVHAEPLYQRALAIQETALGPDHPEVARTLEDYAALLRTAHREGEATALEGRAQAIRAKAAPSPESEPATGPGAPLAEPDLAALSAGAQATPDSAE
jgi:Tetratricopeptide repeat